MCADIPAKVIEVKDDKVIVDILGEKKEASAEIVKPEAGDYVMVKFGAVVEIIPKEAAEDSIKAWKELLSPV